MSDKKLYMGVEVADASLKVAVFDAEERRVLKTAVLETETSPMDDVFAFESVLEGWMEFAKIESVEAISVTVPAFRSIVRQVFVPPEAAKNLDDYLKWYVRLITNAEAGAYVVDYQVLSGNDNLGLTVMLIAIRHQWIDNMRKGFRNKSLAPKSLDVDVLSVMNLMDFAENSKDLECVVKADYAGVTLLWLTKDNLQALRCVSTLSLVNKTREEAYAILADGIAEQISKAQEENAVIVTKLVNLCGEMASDPYFMECLRKVLPNCQLTLMDSFSNIRLPVEAEDSAAVLSCTGAIGAALYALEGV